MYIVQCTSLLNHLKNMGQKLYSLMIGRHQGFNNIWWCPIFECSLRTYFQMNPCKPVLKKTRLINLCSKNASFSASWLTFLILKEWLLLGGPPSKCSDHKKRQFRPCILFCPLKNCFPDRRTRPSPCLARRTAEGSSGTSS